MQTVQLNMEKYDHAMLQLSYARSTLFCLACVVENEGNQPIPSIIAEAMHNVVHNLNQADTALAC